MIPVIDVFAGPGGLNEGFSRVRDSAGNRVFDIAASFEMEDSALETLRLRSAVRELTESQGGIFSPYLDFLNGRGSLESFLELPDVRAAYGRALDHVHDLELGPATHAESDEKISRAIGKDDRWVLIGGPPCQAYSLVGRSRRTHDPTFEEDKKHFLYQEYLRIIDRFRPAVFVMENVKGMLSAGVRGRGIFERIMEDLQANGNYTIHSLVEDREELRPQDFVIRAEQYGVPQRRHRVILLGLRTGAVSRRPTLLESSDGLRTVREAISDLEPIASRVTGARSQEEADRLREGARQTGMREARSRVNGFERRLPGPDFNRELTDWLQVPGLNRATLHDPRRHMVGDLERYSFLATAAEYGFLPDVTEFPSFLKPRHRNMQRDDVPFKDRFKVQTWDEPSSTVASHISKDGHYYIHPDARQMRSLSVREAARLQTFPDDYYFRGTQTQRYQQVGNAVPPLLAKQIAEVVAHVLD